MIQNFIERGGPWLNFNETLQLLKVDDLTLLFLIKRSAVVAIMFPDKQYYFPAKQFVENKIVLGIPELLGLTRRYSKTSDHLVVWLAKPIVVGSYVYEDTTNWEGLAESIEYSYIVKDWMRELMLWDQ